MNGTQVRAVFCMSKGERRVLLDRRFPTVERKIGQRNEKGEEINVLPFKHSFLLDDELFPIPQSSTPVGQIPPVNKVGDELVKSKMKNIGLVYPIWPIVYLVHVGIIIKSIFWNYINNIIEGYYFYCYSICREFY